ncbi:MAG: phytoene desaturase family protein, partial [Bacilli bacterium]
MSVVVVGAGIGGLVTAIMLQQQGFQVRIVERNTRGGGRLAFVERDGYRVDRGPTIVLMPDQVHRTLRACGIGADEYTLERIDPLYTVNFPDGKAYSKYSNPDAQLAYLAEHWPEERENWDKWYAEMGERFEYGEAAILNETFFKKSALLSTDTVKLAMRMRLYETVARGVKRYFQTPHLQEAYSLQTLYIGGNPFDVPFVYNLVSYSEHAHGIWYVKGGYASLVRVLERR